MKWIQLTKAIYERVTDGLPKDFSLTKPDTSTSCQRMQSGFFFFFFPSWFCYFWGRMLLSIWHMASSFL